MLDALLLLIGLLALGIAWWYLSIPANLPPGPFNAPFIGVGHQLLFAGRAVEKLKEWKERYGPVYKFYVAERLVVVLADFQSIQETLIKQGDVYAGRYEHHMMIPKELNPRYGLINSEGELWKEQRRFAISTLRDLGFGRPILEPKIKHEVELMLELMLDQKKPFDPANALNNAVSNVICTLVFGKRFAHGNKEFDHHLHLIRIRLTESDVSNVSPLVLSPTISSVLRRLPKWQQIDKGNSETLAFVRTLVKEAAKGFDPNGKDEPENYTQAFYRAQTKQGEDTTFTDDQLTLSVYQLFLAGTDTTATTLRWAIFFLARQPDWQDRVYEEIRNTVGLSSIPDYAERNKLPLLNAVIMETQRLADLVPTSVLHRTTHPSQIAGYHIPADTVVVPFLTSVLGDSTVYRNPDVFDPSRFLEQDRNSKEMASLIPFSAGKRACLGESLARMELFLFMVGMLARIKFAFPKDEPLPPNEARTAVIRGPIPYNICAIRRSD